MRPVVGMASTPDGNGCWLVASERAIFSFSDAQFYGSTGNIRLNQPVRKSGSGSVDADGKVSLRFGNKMLHLGVGRPWRGTRVRLYIAGDYVRVVSEEGELLAETTIDPSKGCQRMRKPL